VDGVTVARRALLAVHLSSSVGWMGAVAAYLALDVVTATRDDPIAVRAAYIGMGLVVSYVVVPLALAALGTGVAISLATRWGLFRHWWVLISLLLTLGATAVLLVETSTINRLAAVAADLTTTEAQLRDLGSTLVHSIAGLGVLLLITWLNVYKPRGMTPYGWSKQQEEWRTRQTRPGDTGQPARMVEKRRKEESSAS
jgi:hypothetical protein